MSKGINKNIICIIEQTNEKADKAHQVKTSYASLKKDKKQRNQLDETWDQKCPQCGKSAHIKIAQSNDNGNQGKPYGNCHECDLWLGFITNSFFHAASMEAEREGPRRGKAPRKRSMDTKPTGALGP